ncbi:hypothetical protein RHMOL_Rhmol11G0164100 [Rhododendron molle]|uniref:Uncharacterized protein n=1 Tax=Rhododendron molle TaxID=49168 RepID=A0ACC0LU54_RHOML|nr:hypothetical protein RHMOL_Rhmol11G0164100 [Rhododendron molle]
MLAKAWGTSLGSPPEMCLSVVMLGLPVGLGISSDSDGLKLRTHLRDGFGVEVPIYYQAPKDGEINPVMGFIAVVAYPSSAFIFNSATQSLPPPPPPPPPPTRFRLDPGFILIGPSEDISHFTDGHLPARFFSFHSNDEITEETPAPRAPEVLSSNIETSSKTVAGTCPTTDRYVSSSN